VTRGEREEEKRGKETPNFTKEETERRGGGEKEERQRKKRESLFF